ncbi:hypothetical protein K6W27_16535 [Acetobacter senegalensis]|nr:hypothetical protein [Acetobacter senegalensis]MCG4258811.1 hypothetical protein [Acetobacter senegalensis]MCG4268714.1 hypothetical protein [Acetobacter senegalensis]MPQ74743.1 hypothetical protein [Acetobacter senegalensis]
MHRQKSALNQGRQTVNYTQIAISAVEALIQNGPTIVEDISALLRPLKEGREPTADEWAFARQQLDAANAAVQAG